MFQANAQHKVGMASHIPPDCRFFRIRAVASMLAISERHIFRLVADGSLQAHRFGRATRVSLAAIRRYAFGQHASCNLEAIGSEEVPDDCVFYRIAQVADVLQVTPRHVHRLIKSGTLSCDHFGRSARISLAGLRRCVARCSAN